MLPNVLHQIETGAIRQPHIGQAQVVVIGFEHFDGGADFHRALGFEPHAQQRELEQFQNIGLVIDD
jgi:hypothetical protein